MNILENIFAMYVSHHTKIPRRVNIRKIKHTHTHVQDKDHANEGTVAATNITRDLANILKLKYRVINLFWFRITFFTFFFNI